MNRRSLPPVPHHHHPLRQHRRPLKHSRPFPSRILHRHPYRWHLTGSPRSLSVGRTCAMLCWSSLAASAYPNRASTVHAYGYSRCCSQRASALIQRSHDLTRASAGTERPFQPDEYEREGGGGWVGAAPGQVDRLLGEGMTRIRRAARLRDG